MKLIAEIDVISCQENCFARKNACEDLFQKEG